jgi:hypothetical protein
LSRTTNYGYPLWFEVPTAVTSKSTNFWKCNCNAVWYKFIDTSGLKCKTSKKTSKEECWISGSHSGEQKYFFFSKCNATYFGHSFTTMKNILLKQRGILLAACLASLNLLIMKFSPTSSYFLSLMSKYFPHHHDL